MPADFLKSPFASIVSYIGLGEQLDSWQILGAALVAGRVVLLSWSRGRRQALGSQHEASARYVNLGTPAPDVSLPSLTGDTVSLRA